MYNNLKEKFKNTEFKLSAPIEVRNVEESDDGNLKIAGYANTTSKDRHGTVILSSVWNKKALEAFKKNPVMLLNHNSDRVIGTFNKVKQTEEGLYVEGEILGIEEEVITKVKAGLYKTFSVGFGITKFDDSTFDYDEKTDTVMIKSNVDLREVSVVPIPSNKDSLFEIKKCFEADQEFRNAVQDRSESVEEIADESITEPEDTGSITTESDEGSNTTNIEKSDESESTDSSEKENEMENKENTKVETSAPEAEVETAAPEAATEAPVTENRAADSAPTKPAVPATKTKAEAAAELVAQLREAGMTDEVNALLNQAGETMETESKDRFSFNFRNDNDAIANMDYRR